jgi:hypothetical protein
MRRALLCWAAVAVCACGPTAPAASDNSPAIASVSPSPSTSPSPAALPVEVLSTIHLNGDETVDLVTISNGTATVRHLLGKQPVGVIDANQRIALITTNNATRLATLDLDTGAIRGLGINSPGGFGPGVLSPDGTRAAVAARPADLGWEILIVDLASSTARPLLELSASAYNRAGLDPIRWTNAGILVSPGVWDGGRSKLMILDPHSANLTTVTDARVDMLSPGGTMMAAVGHAQLGDGPYGGQGSWPNQLMAGPVGPPLAVIAEQKNRAFSALDVADDGSVLYTQDNAPFGPDGGYNKTPPAPDMGIYLAMGGQSIHELGETYVGQWWAGSFAGPGLALVTRAVEGDPGSAEVDLVGLCATSGCNPTVQAVTTITGSNPEPRLTLLRPVPAI